MILEYSNIIVLVLALGIDLIFGEYPSKFHPVVWMGRYIGFLWEKRIQKNYIWLFIWGCFIIISGIFIFSISIYFSIQYVPQFVSFLLSIFLLKAVFSFKALMEAGKDVALALNDNDIEKARFLTSWHLVSRDVKDLNQGEIVSSVIESLSENITDGFVSPLFYYSIGGLPLAWAYRFVNTSDSMIAYRKGDFEWGGKFTAWIDSFLNFIPSRLSGFLITLASFFLRENWKNSFKIMVQQHKRTSSPNAGWTMASMAGALNIVLEKKNEYILEGGEDSRQSSLIFRAIKIVFVTNLLGILLTIFFIVVIKWI